MSDDNNIPVSGNDMIRLIIALFIPPLGVALQVGLGMQFWLNLLLTIFGYIPGVLHAFYIILREKD